MSEKVFGYVRVSTKAQREDRQLAAMRAFGIPEERIVVEKQSGKNFQRPAYLRLVQALESGDVLVVKSIDRLGRNYQEILEQWACLTKERGIAVVVLDMPLLDTRADRDLTGRFVADLVLQILSYVAQAEREFLRRRQAEGIAAAKERGIRFGRERISMPEQFEELAADWWHGRISAVQAGKELGISRTTFKTRAVEWCEREGLGKRLGCGRRS